MTNTRTTLKAKFVVLSILMTLITYKKWKTGYVVWEFEEYNASFFVIKGFTSQLDQQMALKMYFIFNYVGGG